jgi:type I restriction enzyme, S subunit
MWTGNIKFSSLADAGRWKVELFAESGEKPLTSSTLPMVQLGELFVESRLTTDPQMQPNKPFTYIGMENVQSGTGDLVGSTGCLGREIKSRSKVVMRDQVLYGRLRPNLNKVHHFTGEDGQFICSGEFLVLNAKENVVRPKVLRELLSSKIVLAAVIKFIGGASLPRVSIADLASIKVPLPSMEDQAKFEEYVREIDTRRGKIKRELEEMPTHLERRLQEMLQIKLVGEGVL